MGSVVGDYRADLIVDGKVIVECKVATKILPIHEMQLVNYLKASTITVGLILNFGPEPSVRRLVLSFPRSKTAVIRC
jgi:GxxExxY protein